VSQTPSGILCVGAGRPPFFFAMGIGCAANWVRNRSFHCAITGPLFLALAIFFLLAGSRDVHVNARLVWSLLFIGTAIAFLPEWRYAKRSVC
jgi:hypothetical protein